VNLCGDFKSDLLAFLEEPEQGNQFNPAVWDADMPFMEELRAIEGSLLRYHVRDAFQHSTHKGVIYSLVWGYPQGKTYGMEDSKKENLKSAMRDPDLIVDMVDALRRFPRSALDTVKLLNEQKGLGIASTTKIAYFAGLDTRYGPCLIYDRQVTKALFKLPYRELADAKAALWADQKNDGPEKRMIDWAAGRDKSYSVYLDHAYQLARLVGRGTEGEDVERFLFVRGKEMG
jgi:hypothetical protein